MLGGAIYGPFVPLSVTLVQAKSYRTDTWPRSSPPAAQSS